MTQSEKSKQSAKSKSLASEEKALIKNFVDGMSIAYLSNKSEMLPLFLEEVLRKHLVSLQASLKDEIRKKNNAVKNFKNSLKKKGICIEDIINKS